MTTSMFVACGCSGLMGAGLMGMHRSMHVQGVCCDLRNDSACATLIASSLQL